MNFYYFVYNFIKDFLIIFQKQLLNFQQFLGILLLKI